MSNAARFAAEQPIAPKSHARWWLRRLVVLGVVLVVGVVAAFFVWRQMAWNAREAEIAKIRAAGAPVWFADLRPEPLNPKEDATPLLFKAFEAIKPLPEETADALRELTWPLETNDEEEEEAVPFDLREDALPNGDAGDEIPPANEGDPDVPEIAQPRTKPLPRTFEFHEARLVEELRPHVEANRDFYDQLEKSLAKGRFQFGRDYDELVPLELTYPHRASHFEAMRLLRARWRCQIHDGDYSAAVNSCQNMLRFVHGLILPSDTELDASANNARIHRMLGFIAEMIERGVFEADRRFQVADQLDRIEQSFRARPALVFERARILTLLENMFEHGFDGEPLVKSGIVRSVTKPYVWSNQVWYLEHMEPRIKYADRYDDEAIAAIREIEENEESLSESNWSRRVWFGHGMLPMSDLNTYLRETRDRLRAARVALRLDAFRREHGRLPKSLDEIKNAEFPEVPTDLAAKKPLSYIAEKDAFTICPAAYVDVERRRLLARPLAATKRGFLLGG